MTSKFKIKTLMRGVKINTNSVFKMFLMVILKIKKSSRRGTGAPFQKRLMLKRFMGKRRRGNSKFQSKFLRKIAKKKLSLCKETLTKINVMSMSTVL